MGRTRVDVNWGAGVDDTAQLAAANYGCVNPKAVPLPNSCPNRPTKQPQSDPVFNYMGCDSTCQSCQKAAQCADMHLLERPDIRSQCLSKVCFGKSIDLRHVLNMLSLPSQVCTRRVHVRVHTTSDRPCSGCLGYL